jgi:branched-chain amino acid transport system ATP-binding protein
VTAALLEVEKLEVRYGDLIGVADVSLAVPQGGIVALLGSNGAGKTSTLNAIAGLVPASAGSIRLDGRDIARQPAYAIVRKGLALSPEGWRLFVQQSVENNLLLGATPLAGQVAHRADAGARLCAVSRARRAAQAAAPAPCRAASARCWRWAAR